GWGGQLREDDEPGNEWPDRPAWSAGPRPALPAKRRRYRRALSTAPPPPSCGEAPASPWLHRVLPRSRVLRQRECPRNGGPVPLREARRTAPATRARGPRDRGSRPPAPSSALRALGEPQR